MEGEPVTVDEYDAELAAYFAADPEPKREDGWFTVKDIKNLPSFQGKSIEAIRHRLEKDTNLETTRYGWRKYYRIRKDEELMAGNCSECGAKLQIVRPGKYQCPRCG